LPPLEVLYEDNHLLVVVKPAGLPTMGAAAGEESLVTIAKQYIKECYSKRGNVYLGVVSRLDEPVSGVVVFARTSKAAARLSEQFRSRTVEKLYWAIIERRPQPESGELVDWLIKDDDARRMVVAPEQSAGAHEARLKYRPVRDVTGGSLIEIEPETGRKHQIRVQFASRGLPILGDVKYGSRRRWLHGIALHARSLAFDHPTQKAQIRLEAQPPASWRRMLGLTQT
jgi:23S rRNA pseudouridine1911/1915/1917 synthase